MDLKETSLDQFYEALKAQIQASEPGVTLNKIDRPQIELIHEKARQRVDQYRRRMKLQARKARSHRQAGLQLRPGELPPLGLAALPGKSPPHADAAARRGWAPRHSRACRTSLTRAPRRTPGKVLETERQMFALRDGDNQNPYSWDFDLCSLTLGNFNYRKMTLVRDYAKLIETDMASGAFDTVFSLTPKPPEEAPPPPLELADQHLVISCDATQASAIARARTGASYIIQGPPGTGKSQTITNLIADYVARGKRVLFVCEKRAAIDVVFHRLRQQGLDELCCLIHDSQTDKKAFIQNLKQTYEKFLSQADLDPGRGKARAATLEGDGAGSRQPAALLRSDAAGARAHRRRRAFAAASAGGIARARAANCRRRSRICCRSIPLWLQHGDVVNRLQSALADLGEELCFAKHPLALARQRRVAGRPPAGDFVQASRPSRGFAGCDRERAGIVRPARRTVGHV